MRLADYDLVELHKLVEPVETRFQNLVDAFQPQYGPVVQERFGQARLVLPLDVIRQKRLHLQLERLYPAVEYRQHV